MIPFGRKHNKYKSKIVTNICQSIERFMTRVEALMTRRFCQSELPYERNRSVEKDRQNSHVDVEQMIDTRLTHDLSSIRQYRDNPQIQGIKTMEKEKTRRNTREVDDEIDQSWTVHEWTTKKIRVFRGQRRSGKTCRRSYSWRDRDPRTWRNRVSIYVWTISVSSCHLVVLRLVSLMLLRSMTIKIEIPFSSQTYFDFHI